MLCQAVVCFMFCLLGAVLQGAFSQGVAPHPTKTFLKKGLGTQKLLKMGVIYQPPRWHAVFIFSPLRQTPPPPRRRCRLPTKTTPRPHSCKHGSVRRYFYCLSFGQGRWGNDLTDPVGVGASTTRPNVHRKRHLNHKPNGLHEQ